jgi:hypothetical protein
MQKRFNFIKKLYSCAFLIATMFSINNVCANEQSGLILSGIDTMLQSGQCNGMDFILGRPCTSSTDNGCNGHFNIGYENPDGFRAWLTGQGLVLDKGKMNLDSIKSAPPDSQMKEDLGIGLYRIFCIVPDSLKKCIGNCYILKTPIDPRSIWNRPFYAKFKILELNEIDTTIHSIRMVFLWAFNRSGPHDLTTAGLDTFHLETPTLSQPASNSLMKASHSSASQAVFKVSGNNFSLPHKLLGKVKWLSIWDLQGKRLAEIKLNKSNSLIQMPKDLRRNGILIVRAEINN